MPKIKRPFGRYTAIQYCDKLWSIIIRAGGECCAVNRVANHVCSGALQGMHIEGRTSWALRHELFNGLPGCQGLHAYYTFRPMEWSAFVQKHFRDRYKLISRTIAAGDTQKRNYYVIADKLRARLRVTDLKHTYSKEDQRIINSIINGVREL
jgi:hypothetical protein